MKHKKLKKMFKFINREMFDSRLDMPHLFMLSSKQCKRLHPIPIDGICIPTQNGYFIGIHKDLTKTEVFDTLVHELIHIDLIMRKGYWEHGKPFKKMCRKGIDIFYHKML